MQVSDIILEKLAECGTVSSLELAACLKLDHQAVVGGLKSLESIEGMVNLVQNQDNGIELTEEGDHIVQNGSHEFRIFNSIPVDHSVSPDYFDNLGAYSKVGLSKALAAKWVVMDKSGGGPKIRRNVDSVADSIQACLKKLKEMSITEVKPAEIADLKKRKLIVEQKRTWFQVSKGPAFTMEIKKGEVDITQEMISNGSWATTNFKPYNFNAKGAIPTGGHLHPLLRVRTEFARILTEMGFMEMPTNNYIESSFWNFDALFQPQQHPARDAHDTFFISDPATTDVVKKCPKDYVDRVAKVHNKGDYGSMGYQYDWKIEEAAKNILRTHTTAVSSRMLYKLAQTSPIKPVKYFSIDRVFRNESLDATHLAEFHQIEGLVADFGIGLGHLKAVIRAFFAKLGLTQLRFKPAYNPYTEPSMEIFSYHPGLGKWVEIGNSGVFRPEMLRPMGLPPNLNVIAWGLSLERPTMIRYGYKNIRDLIGPKVDLSMIYNSPICRIDKN